MTPFPWSDVAIIAVLILLNGLFAMSELAIVSSRDPRLQAAEKRGSRGAKIARQLAADPGRFLSTVQVGITLVGVLAGAYSGATVANKLGDWLAGFSLFERSGPSLAIAIVVVLVTYLTLIVGELVPKRMALNNAEAIASSIARPMAQLARLASPIVWFLRFSTEGALRLLGLPIERQSTVTEEEVKTMIAEGTEAGVFHAAERDMIDGVLRLADRPVRAIMTPRIEVVWLDPSQSLEEIRAIMEDSGHSRFPIGRKGIDDLEGVVQTKDLLERLMRNEPFDLEAVMREPPVVHDGAPVLSLLEVFRQSSVHMAFVVDEYGVFEGLVTPTDILSAIAGEFPEGEQEEGEETAVRRDDGSWLIDGMAPIEEVERLLGQRGLHSEEDDYHTLAGFVLWKLGRLPKVGESFEYDGLCFEVVDMDGRRIDRLLVSELPQPTAAANPE